MKPTAKTAFFILLIALTVAVGWWLSSPKKQPASIATTPKPVPTMPQATTSAPIQSDTPPEIVQPHARTPYLGLKDPRWIERRRLREEDPAYQWRTPIEFFGKVIDERNQPVAGAEIEYSWNGTIEKYGKDGVVHKTMTSDANGFFHIHGIEGKILTVLVSKDGYYRRKSWNGGSFDYAAFWEPIFIEPDRGKLVVFYLVKRPVAEPTYRIGSRIFLEPPALEAHLDLLSPTAQSAAPADLHVRITRPPGASYENPFDWSVTIEGLNGAEIVETTDEFMLQAPVDGYQPKLIRDYKNPTGNARQKVRFYVRSRARKLYAAVDFEMAAYRRMNGSEPASIVISATVNPNYSPNVEYDPEKNLRLLPRHGAGESTREHLPRR
jgi:hypothetical protein